MENLSKNTYKIMIKKILNAYQLTTCAKNNFAIFFINEVN